MAENQLAPKNDRIRTEAREADWSSLLARAIDDMTRIVHSELRLLSASMKTMLGEEIDRVFAFLATGVLMVGGAICGLAAAILFLHEYAKLPWWQSFGITGLALFAIAIAVGAFATSRPKTLATSHE
jgi:hypothetical protein